MVRYLCEYVHEEIHKTKLPPQSPITETREFETKTTYNILLEYGEFDLEGYFYERLPPVFHTEIEGFWKRLFEVAHALEGIHNLKIDNNGELEEFHG